MHTLKLLCCIIWIGCTSCFGRFVMNERQIKKYYKNKPVKPTYFSIKNDSVLLFCATTGADTLPPLLMIHGAPGAWYGSRHLLDDTILQKQFHIISVDRLGYNKSRFKGKRRAVTSIHLQAVAIHEALRVNRSFKTGVAMGSSYGAPIAAKLTLLYPQQFHHLIMLAPAIDPDREKFWWFHPYLQTAGFRYLLPRYIKSASAEKFAHIDELNKLLPEWKNLTVPVTVMQGGKDKIIDPENLEFAREHLKSPKANFIFLPEGHHLIRRQYPEIVRYFLAKTLPDVKPTKNLHNIGTNKP